MGTNIYLIFVPQTKQTVSWDVQASATDKNESDFSPRTNFEQLSHFRLAAKCILDSFRTFFLFLCVFYVCSQSLSIPFLPPFLELVWFIREEKTEEKEVRYTREHNLSQWLLLLLWFLVWLMSVALGKYLLSCTHFSLFECGGDE